MKVISLIGARPQFIKEAVLHKEFKKYNIEEIIVHSGQHYDVNMSDVFFKTLEINKPDYFLNIGSCSHAEMTGRIMIEFEKIVIKEMPDFVIVYGDTNTTIAGALACSKLKVPVAHVEAGERQNPKDMPEEINRVVTDRISNILFCSSKNAIINLSNEGISKNVFFTGDVMFDLFFKMQNHMKCEVYEKLELEKGNYIILTLHRDFNVDIKDSLKIISKEIQKLSDIKRIIFPIHPRTKKRIDDFNLNRYFQKVDIIEPTDYLNLLYLLKNSEVIITDSGGLQKEAYFAKKRAVIVMPDTGWIDLVRNGWNVLSKKEDIFKNSMKFIDVVYTENLYGDGKAANKICKILMELN